MRGRLPAGVGSGLGVGVGRRLWVRGGFRVRGGFGVRGGDLATAVKEARSAGSLPADGGRGTAKVTVKSAASAALNTVAFDTPPVPDGGTVRQQLRVHAADTGRLALRFATAPGQLIRVTPVVRLGRPTPDTGATCTVPVPELDSGSAGANLVCELEPGDHVIGYELTGATGQYARKYVASTEYDLYTAATPPEAYVRRTSAPFTVQGSPVRPFHGLMARDTTGKLWKYSGTRDADAPLAFRDLVGTGGRPTPPSPRSPRPPRPPTTPAA